MVYVCSLPLTPTVIISFISSQVTPLMQVSKDPDLLMQVPDFSLYFSGMLAVVIGYMNLSSFVDLELPLPPFKLLLDFPVFTWLKNVRIYIETAIVVVISYVSLLIVNRSYIWLVVFPIIAIGFIVALCSELSHQDQGGSQQQSNEGEAPASAGGKTERLDSLEAVALVPYWALCAMGHFHADKFAVSQFLLFFSFMLGALTMMMTRLGLAIAGRGVAPASELLRKASLVVLLVAVHALAAELLGENVLLFCLPEIAPVLLWFSFRLDGAIITADKIKLDSRVLVLLCAAPPAVLAILAGYMDDSVLYWCSKALVSCAVSVLLTSYIVFMLCQWPGQRDGTVTDSLQEAVDLLKFWANWLWIAVATLLVFTSLASVHLVLLQESMASASAGQILQRLCQKFLQFIV